MRAFLHLVCASLFFVHTSEGRKEVVPTFEVLEAELSQCVDSSLACW